MMLNKLFGLGRERPEPIPAPVLERILREAARKLPDLRWAVIITTNDLVQEMYDPFGKTDRESAAAMTSAALSLGERISGELGHGQLTCSVTAGEGGVFIVQPLGEGYASSVSLPAEAEIGAAIGALWQAASSVLSAHDPGMG